MCFDVENEYVYNSNLLLEEWCLPIPDNFLQIEKQNQNHNQISNCFGTYLPQLHVYYFVHGKVIYFWDISNDKILKEQLSDYPIVSVALVLPFYEERASFPQVDFII